MRPPRTDWPRAALFLAAISCGGDEEAAVGTRGAPTVATGKAGGGGTGGGTAGGSGARPVQGGPEEVNEPVPDHPKTVLTREDFSLEARDPFQSFLGNEAVEAPAAGDGAPSRERDVRLNEYNFEDLRLIGIVMSGHGIQPRALFLSNDGKSKSVKQGEYFSRAQVLLAAVNRDYIEVEVVDEDLAKGLNMAAGERRPIYLKKD
jgi:Tfp pilus assembly protein PilP